MRRPPHLAAALGARSSSLRIAAISAWSLLLWGGWAFAANLGHGLAVAARAGVTQGLVSLTVTFLMTLILEVASRRCVAPWSRILGPAALAEGFHALYTVGLHTWIGTPEIALTTLPLIACGLAYSLTYAAALARAAQAEPALGRRFLPAAAEPAGAPLRSVSEGEVWS